MKFRAIIGSLALAMLAATPVRAQDCTLKLVTSVDMLQLGDQPMVRGIENIKLGEALADCEAGLRSHPSFCNLLDSKGLIFYRLGRFQDALDSYNAALKSCPKLASSLYMRGQAKRKLGDAAGGTADIAAAKALDADVKKTFDGAGIAD